MFDFDEIIRRRGTGSVKWDKAPGDDVIPLWVADMDFRVAPAIEEAIRRRAAHGVFGYTTVGDDYYNAIISWFSRRHQWTIRREEILYTTGVVPAVSATIKALTMPGEKVLILSPAYNCFFSSIRNNGCEVLECPLSTSVASDKHGRTQNSETSLASDEHGRTQNSEIIRDNPCQSDATEVPLSRDNPCSSDANICWPDFEAKCADEKTTVFLLCNPHNPTGRVWTRDELTRMNDICLRHGVKVVSDEIHCEIIMPGHRFQPFAAVSDACRENSVILNSPSKSFNTAGLQTANIICAQPEWRRRIDRAININEVCDLNPFGPVALIAAYNESEQWIDELCHYIWDNYTALCDFIREHIPTLRVCPMEGTYLPWIDITALGITAQQLADRLLHDAKVWVNPGTLYGPQSGEGYIRLNIACPRKLLMEALQRMANVINKI